MHKRIAKGLVTCAILLLAFAGAGVPANAGYKEAAAAYDRGDFKSAHEQLTRLAAAGQANAEFLLGAMYFYGNGVAQDNGLAAIWFHKAAIKGNPNGQLAFGSLHIRGIGVHQDLGEAYKWLTLAANNGSQGLRQQAVLLREQAAKLMTQQEIASAQKAASAFTPKRAGLSESK